MSKKSKGVNAAAWFYSQPGFRTPTPDETLCRGCNKAPAVVGSFCAACRAAMGLK